jgi:hypothetical protein
MRLFGINNAERVADLFAIPLFLIAFIYFLRKSQKSHIEDLITVFLGVGLILDFIFTLDFLQII